MFFKGKNLGPRLLFEAKVDIISPTQYETRQHIVTSYQCKLERFCKGKSLVPRLIFAGKMDSPQLNTVEYPGARFLPSPT